MSTSFRILDINRPEEITAYVKESNWLSPGETIESVARAGEGNMNLVVRVRTNERSFVLKQSRPWVEKYPDIPAPTDRIHYEILFYRAIAQEAALSARMPNLLGVDESNNVVLLEDLGEVSDYTRLYHNGNGETDLLETLASWLSTLHRTTFPLTLWSELENRAMRELNHAHIFRIPLERDNGLDLDGITHGLQEEADRLKSDTPYVNAVNELGAIYLSNGPYLLHGDFFPGSWVETPEGPFVIDPEFTFFGPAGFDLGVMLAHLYMIGLSDADIQSVIGAYQEPEIYDPSLMRRFAGVEIMRRLIGVAQLPMDRTLADKRELLALSRELVLEDNS